MEIVITVIESRLRFRAMILLRGNDKQLSLYDGTCARIFRYA